MFELESSQNPTVFPPWEYVKAIYCLYVIFAALITQELPKRWDYAFFAYLGTCVVAIWDLGASFWKNVSWTDENGGENDDP